MLANIYFTILEMQKKKSSGIHMKCHFWIIDVFYILFLPFIVNIDYFIIMLFLVKFLN